MAVLCLVDEDSRFLLEKSHLGMKSNKSLMIEATAAQALRERYINAKILRYVPCCKVHGQAVCPAIPCPESVHAKFHQSKSKVRLFFGGNRSGKTVAGACEMVMRTCFKKHLYTGEANRFPSYNRVFCSDFALIEKNILPKLKEWLPKNSLRKGETFASKEEAWENSYDRQFKILHLNSGSTIDFMSYDQDLSKTESVELDNIWADEEMPERFYTSSRARLVSRGGRFWMTVTPLYSLTWALQFLDGGDSDVEVFVADMRDNPYNTEDEISSFVRGIEQTNPLELDARIHGRFLELQGLVYKELRRDVHLVESSKPQAGCPVYFTMDPHPRKPSVMNWAFVTPKEDIVFFDELEMSGTAEEIASVIRQKEKQHGQPTVMRFIDPAAKAQGSNLAFQTDTLREFEREGLSFALADNSDAGYNVVHEYLTWDTARPMSSLNRPRLFFTKDCPKTWHGMTHLVWDEFRFGRDLRDAKEKVKDHKKDFPDCVRYLVSSRPRFFVIMEPVDIPKVSSKPKVYQPGRPSHEWRRQGLIQTKLDIKKEEVAA
jgi:phage terminase large subunit-like protein